MNQSDCGSRSLEAQQTRSVAFWSLLNILPVKTLRGFLRDLQVFNEMGSGILDWHVSCVAGNSSLLVNICKFYTIPCV